MCLYATLLMYISARKSSQGVRLNAFSPISITELGIVTEINREQYSNALRPIRVTEFGILIELKFVQL